MNSLSHPYSESDDPVRMHNEVSPFANRELPRLRISSAGLEPYAGPWGMPEILHLLRRTTFGPLRADAMSLASKTMNEAVDLLLAPPSEETSLPLNVSTSDMVPIGDTWVYQPYQAPGSTTNPTGVRTSSLKAWWTSLILQQSFSIRERMVLFWHNLFVTERDAVGDPRFTYRYAALLRKHALGNWKDLTRAVTVDGAMLRYLNGNTNTRTNPNENYGRELQELFTIGKGPEAAPGDYTFYTEQDVKAAARVLTGWQDDATQLLVPTGSPWKFTSSRHDTTSKQFSARYGNRVIAGNTDGLRELNDLLDMIFTQEETAKALCRRLYRWFVYYVIDDWTEANIIVPLAQILRTSNYAVTPVLSVLFRSAHFYDANARGCMIKSPVDLITGLMRSFAVAFPTGDVVNRYRMWSYLAGKGTEMQQDIADPPSVAGWSAYYQSPQFYQIWINSDTLPRRSSFCALMLQTGYSAGGFRLLADPVALARALTNPADPDALIAESTLFLFAIPVTASQRTFLKSILLPGLPDYEWTLEWGAYVADPGNAGKLAAVKSKLQSLYAFMVTMPEFQLQ